MEDNRFTFLEAELLELEAESIVKPNNPRTWQILAAMQGVQYRHVIREELLGLNPSADHNLLFEKVIFAARKAIELAPNDAQNYVNLASCLWGRSEELFGLKWCRLSLEERLNEPVFISSPFTDEVRGLYEKALALSPEDTLPIIMLCHDSLKKGNADEAEKLAAVITDPKEIESDGYQFLLAEIDLQSKRFDEAIARFRKMVVREPHQAFARCHLIEAYRLAGRFDEMLDEIEFVVKSWPKTYSVHKSLALYHESQGRHEEAKKAWQIFRRAESEEFFRNLNQYFDVTP